MTKRKISFPVDECIGKPIMLALAERLFLAYRQTPLAHGFCFEHITDLFRQGTLDEHWVPQKAHQRCTIITADRGKGGAGKKGTPLTRLCRLNGITHVVLNTALHNSTSSKKAEAIEAVFPKLLELAKGPRGVKYRLVLRTDGRIDLVNADLEAAKRKKRPTP